MEKLSHFLTSPLELYDARVVFIVFSSLSSYYLYKKVLPLFSSDRNQLWKKIPFIQKKVENEIQKMKKKNDQEDELYYSKLVE
jgi:hypothetical protein